VVIEAINRLTAELSIKPYSSACYSFNQNGIEKKQTAWLVPHVIRHKEDSEVITWRCNWGHVCEASCIYALNKLHLRIE
jgi:hypothetical protein